MKGPDLFVKGENGPVEEEQHDMSRIVDIKTPLTLIPVVLRDDGGNFVVLQVGQVHITHPVEGRADPKPVVLIQQQLLYNVIGQRPRVVQPMLERPVSGRPDAAILEMKDRGDNVFYGG